LLFVAQTLKLVGIGIFHTEIKGLRTMSGLRQMPTLPNG